VPIFIIEKQTDMKKTNKKNQVKVIIVPTRVETRNGWVNSEDTFNVVVVDKDCSVKVYSMEEAIATKASLEVMFSK
jgi:predicted transcriptional regulator